MAIALMFYPELYATTMLCIALDMYIAVAAPLWHRVHLRRGRVLAGLIFVSLLIALYIGVFSVFVSDETFQYYPNIFISFLSFNFSVRNAGLLTPFLIIYIFPSISIIVLNVLIYIRLKRLARDRLKLGVRSAPIEDRRTTIIQQQPQRDETRAQNSSGVSSHNKPTGIVLNELNNRSECIELHVFSSVEPNQIHSRSYVQQISPDVAVGSQSGNIFQGRSETITDTSQETANLHSARVADCGRKFKLTFLLSMRYLIAYSIADVAVLFFYIFNMNDAALLLFYMIFVNGFGDYVLYGIFNPRYRSSLMEIYSRFLARTCGLDLSSHPKLRRFISSNFF